MIPQHSSLTFEHPTPLDVIGMARATMGGIDLDPASTEEFNGRVRATRIYTSLEDGLSMPWGTGRPLRVFVNPPGGSLTLTKKQEEGLDATFAVGPYREQLASEAARWKTRSRAVAWWRKLMEEHMKGAVVEAVFIGFTLEILRATQGEPQWQSAMEYPFCVPSQRLKFAGDQPTHANVIVYVGPGVGRFRAAFRELGEFKP